MQRPISRADNHGSADAADADAGSADADAWSPDADAGSADADAGAVTHVGVPMVRGPMVTPRTPCTTRDCLRRHRDCGAEQSGKSGDRNFHCSSLRISDDPGRDDVTRPTVAPERGHTSPIVKADELAFATYPLALEAKVSRASPRQIVPRQENYFRVGRSD
jgi:hypothetical protein